MTNLYYQIIPEKELPYISNGCDLFVFSEDSSFLEDGGAVYDDVTQILNDLGCWQETECFHDLAKPLETVLGELREHGYNPIEEKSLVDES